jgi:SAM-dependent methyltransferase
MGGTERSERGSTPEERAFWSTMYAQTPYTELPWFDTGPSEQVTEAVRDRFFPPGARTLDIGCGAGSNVLYLAREGYVSHGIDLSPAAIEAAQRRAATERLRIDVRVGDALALEFPDASFDAVTDNGCFHTLGPERRRDYARELHRVLRPGGAFLLGWIGREHTSPMGPPHRPSVGEVAEAFESDFILLRTQFHPAESEERAPWYDARLRARTEPQPPPR